MSVLLIITILALICAGCTAWSPGTTRHDRKLDRRGFISSAIIGSTTIINTSSSVAHAASKDEENIVKGYNRLQYLLDNWEEEVCTCVYISHSYINMCISYVHFLQLKHIFFIYLNISLQTTICKTGQEVCHVFLYVHILCSFQSFVNLSCDHSFLI